MIVIGVDFDNTIVCYDQLFYRAALDRQLIPGGLPATKEAVRDFLRQADREDAWTELQAWVYGEYIRDADPFAGFGEFLANCAQQGHVVSIISHKTRRPYRGPDLDLRAAATSWLESQGFLAPAEFGIPPERLFFEDTKQAKLARIGECRCRLFVDDLPEFLGDPSFPAGVQRILFDPQRRGAAADAGVVACESWNQITDFVRSRGGPMTPNPTEGPQADALRRSAAALLESVGIRQEFELLPLSGGRNNRVYAVNAGDDRFALKWYYSQSAARDRLASEFEFCEFCRDHNVARVPRPLARNADRQLALFEWVEGRRLGPEEAIVAWQIDAALQFVGDLNRHRQSPQADRLMNAAEACFRMIDHLTCIDRRVARLESVEPHDALHLRAADWIRSQLRPAWQRVRESIVATCLQLEDELPRGDRCLSPSDFGFHNALLGEGKEIWFLDFEYAGWDDPAKLVCDFFCQVERPVSERHWQRFSETLQLGVEHPAAFAARCQTLFPVYLIKWACIVLNEFLPEHRARRRFSAAAELSAEHFEAQLEKAAALLARAGPLPRGVTD